jgi:hypothetical protein
MEWFLKKFQDQYQLVCSKVDTQHKSISTDAQYVTRHWKFWMKFIAQIQWIHWKTAKTLKYLQISEPRMV